MGDRSSAVVRHANCMVARCCIIIYLAAARLVTTMVEQPASSLMEKHDRMLTLMSKLSWRTVRTYMGSFGGETMKATMMSGGMTVAHRAGLRDAVQGLHGRKNRRRPERTWPSHRQQGAQGGPAISRRVWASSRRLVHAGQDGKSTRATTPTRWGSLQYSPRRIQIIMTLGPMPNSMRWPTIANCL
jgi:hypothetical protein